MLFHRCFLKVLRPHLFKLSARAHGLLVDVGLASFIIFPGEELLTWDSLINLGLSCQCLSRLPHLHAKGALVVDLVVVVQYIGVEVLFARRRHNLGMVEVVTHDAEACL